MRTLCVVLGAVLGLFVGFVWAVDLGWGAKGVMMLFCAMVGIVLGATVALVLGGGPVGTRSLTTALDDEESFPPKGMSEKMRTQHFIIKDGKLTVSPGFSESGNIDQQVSRPLDH